MTTSSRAQRFVAAAVLTAAVLLLGLAPVASASEQSRELDGWIYGRGAAQGSGSGEFSDDGWARGQGMRSQQPSVVDGWSVGQGMRSQPAETAVSRTVPSPDPIPIPLLVLGLVAAALLGAVTATAVGHRRHAPTAH